MPGTTRLIERLGGTPFAAGAHRTVPLDDADRIYVIDEGHLDIFVAEFRGAEVVSRRPFAARVPAGAMALSAPRTLVDGRTLGLLGVPSQNAVIVGGRRADLEGSLDVDLVAAIDEWVRRISEFLAEAGPVPRGTVLVETDPDVPHPPGTNLSAHHLDVVWMTASRPVRLLGRAELEVDAVDIVPLSERTWVATGEKQTRVSAVHTPRAFLTGTLWPALDRLSTLMLRYAAGLQREQARSVERRHRATRDAHLAADRAAEADLGSALRDTGRNQQRGVSGGRSAAEAAVRAVAAAIGVEGPLPQLRAGDARPMEAYLSFARTGVVRARRITLEPGWWKHDGPSFAGVTTEDERPVAVLSDGRGGFRIEDPATGRSQRVGGREAAGIATEGVMLYPSFPARVRGVGAALADAARRVTADVRWVIVMSVLSSLVGLATPLATGYLLGTAIPRGDTPVWVAGLTALLLCGVGAAVFQLVQTFALIRIEGRVDERLQAALWSRVLSLPTGFFRQYAAGDLADRLGGLRAIRSSLSGAAVRTIVGGLFSLSSLGLLLIYSMQLAVVASGLVLALVAGSLLLGRLQVRHHREALRMQGEIDGMLFQMLTGLAKLRVANAEPYIFARWAKLFAGQRRTTLGARRWAAAQVTLNSLFTPLASAVLLAVIWLFLVAGDESSTFGLAEFLVAFTAFGQLAGGVTGLIGAATTVIGVVPLVERVRPVLEAEPEARAARTDPGDLTGDIELRDVHFRYLPDSEKVLSGVSLRIRPGDYVAIVGPSGSGKSTIYRLLFGFERPNSGAVLFDGHDLLSLDLEAVRRHLGVVLQDGQVAADSIRNNVAGSNRLSTADVWEALRAAGLEDDIRAMPMGLHTMLHEGGGGLSGGQRQRLLIARALARRPRILLLDEATSALDNRTQSLVHDALGKLSITRILIAHRLSTVRDVDRIYVLDQGRIAESGGYDELIGRAGLFAELARRQLV